MQCGRSVGFDLKQINGIDADTVRMFVSSLGRLKTIQD